MPNRCFHTLYYRQYKEAVIQEERRKEEEKRKKKSSSGRKGQEQYFQGNILADMRAAREAAEQLEDEM